MDGTLVVAGLVAAGTGEAPSSSRLRGSKHVAVLRLPGPEKTGNMNLDEDRAAAHALLLELVQGCLDDRSHIMPLYNKYRERVMASNGAGSHVPISYMEQFNKVSTLGALYRDEPAFCVAFLVSVGDLTANDITTACDAVSSAALQLLEFCVAMKDDLKLPQELKIKDVALRAFHQRNSILESRLSGFKAAGGIRADGSLNWEKGVYKIETSEQIINTITHVSSGHWLDVSDHVLSITYSLEQNWPRPPQHPAVLEQEQGIGCLCQGSAAGVGAEQDGGHGRREG
eukprot:9166993-Lingulodinium_polyedra.AAC.1